MVCMKKKDKRLPGLSWVTTFMGLAKRQHLMNVSGAATRGVL